MAARANTPAALALLAALALGAHGAPTLGQMVTPALRACRTVADGPKRLSCYDAEMSRIEASARSEATGASRASSSATASARPEAPLPSRISAHVTTVAHEASGRYVVSLDNGQVWLQTEDNLGFDPRPGSTVTVRRGMLGAYWMTAGGHSVVAVRRLR